MNIRNRKLVGTALALGVSLCFAQNYRCDWSVVDIGGGTMGSRNYEAHGSVGQTAVGQMSSSSYQSFIGFWQVDTAQIAIREESQWTPRERLTTTLYSPRPNPCPAGRSVTVNYSLNAEGRVCIQLFDLAGRAIRTIADGMRGSGRYSAVIVPRGPTASARLASGIYFVKMSAGDYEATRKLVLQ